MHSHSVHAPAVTLVHITKSVFNTIVLHHPNSTLQAASPIQHRQHPSSFQCTQVGEAAHREMWCNGRLAAYRDGVMSECTHKYGVMIKVS